MGWPFSCALLIKLEQSTKLPHYESALGRLRKFLDRANLTTSVRSDAHFYILLILMAPPRGFVVNITGLRAPFARVIHW